MNFTSEQRLIVTMLADIQKSLNVDGNVDADLVLAAVGTGNDWALGWEYDFLNDRSETPAHVTHVADVLDMWSIIDASYEALSSASQEAVDTALRHGRPKFPGFDGNNEGRYASAFRTFVNDLGRFEEYKDRYRLNSHGPTVEISERMLEVFEPISQRASLRGDPMLTAEELVEVYRAQIHPSRR